MTSTECPICQQQRPNPGHPQSTTPLPGQPLAGWLHWTTFIMKGVCLVLTRIDPHSGYGLAYPPFNASGKTTCQRFTERLIHHQSIPHSNALDQGTIFTAKEVQWWAHAHRVRWSYHGPHHPKAAGQREESNGLLKTQGQGYFSSNSLQVCKKVLQQAPYALNQYMVLPFQKPG